MFKLALQLTTKISLCNDRTVQCGGHGAFIYVKASGVQRGRLIDIYLEVFSQSLGDRSTRLLQVVFVLNHRSASVFLHVNLLKLINSILNPQCFQFPDSFESLLSDYPCCSSSKARNAAVIPPSAVLDFTSRFSMYVVGFFFGSVVFVLEYASSLYGWVGGSLLLCC